MIGVAALLFAFLLAVIAAMVWQSVRARPAGPPTYVIEEVTRFAFARLSEEACASLDEDDVQRILEWEVHYLQGLARHRTGNGRAAVAGSEDAIDHILERSAAAGHPYPRPTVAEVLQHEAAYLVDIGAVGARVEEET